MEGGRAEVCVDVGRVEPLQGVHDDLLQDEGAQHALGGAHAELVHVVHS